MGIAAGSNLAEYAAGSSLSLLDPFGDVVEFNWTDAQDIPRNMRQAIDDQLRDDLRAIINASGPFSLCRKLALEALHNPDVHVKVNWDTRIQGPAVFRHTDPTELANGMRLNPQFAGPSGNYMPPSPAGDPNPLNNRPTPTPQFPRADAWIVLLHELGHQLPQLRLTDPTVPGNPAGVNLILENTCREEFGMPLRGGYPDADGNLVPPCYGTRRLNSFRLECRPRTVTPREMREAEAQLDRLRKFADTPSPYDNSPETRDPSPEFMEQFFKLIPIGRSDQ
jgi:hypothetical protein